MTSSVITAAGAEINIAGLFGWSSSSEPAADSGISMPDFHSLVHDFGASWQTGSFVWQRRRGHRAKYTAEMLLTPLDGSEQPCGEICRVRGKEISPHGISFTHTTPLPHRVVALRCELSDGIAATLLTRLKWCRFTRGGVYESGGEFLKVIAVNQTAFGDDGNGHAREESSLR